MIYQITAIATWADATDRCKAFWGHNKLGAPIVALFCVPKRVRKSAEFEIDKKMRVVCCFSVSDIGKHMTYGNITQLGSFTYSESPPKAYLNDKKAPINGIIMGAQISHQFSQSRVFCAKKSAQKRPKAPPGCCSLIWYVAWANLQLASADISALSSRSSGCPLSL